MSERLHVFVSFSGHRSRAMGELIRKWVLVFFPDARFGFWNGNQIEVGTDWHGHLRETIHEANVAIFCLTRENVRSQFVVYELGMFQGSGGRMAVLFRDNGLPESALQLPLAMFQSAEFNEESVAQLIAAMGRMIGQEDVTSAVTRRRPDIARDIMTRSLEGAE